MAVHTCVRATKARRGQKVDVLPAREALLALRMHASLAYILFAAQSCPSNNTATVPAKLRAQAARTSCIPSCVLVLTCAPPVRSLPRSDVIHGQLTIRLAPSTVMDVLTGSDHRHCQQRFGAVSYAATCLDRSTMRCRPVMQGGGQ